MEEKLPAIATEFEPDKAIDRINKSIDFLNKLRGVLKEGEDFNKRPGYPKPSMEKPGAEKIAAGLNCGVKILRGENGQVVNEEYGLKQYELVVALINRASGEWVGEGVGTATGAISDMYVYDKKAGKRILKRERASWANNKAMKMAFKSALISATLTIGALSGYFTQDLDSPKQNQKPDKKEPSLETHKEEQPPEETSPDYIPKEEAEGPRKVLLKQIKNKIIGIQNLGQAETMIPENLDTWKMVELINFLATQKKPIEPDDWHKKRDELLNKK